MLMIYWARKRYVFPEYGRTIKTKWDALIWSFSEDILQYVPDMWKENRPVGVGGAEGYMEPPQFNPSSNRGTDYIHHIATCSPPPQEFLDLPSALGKDLRVSGRKLGAKSQLTVTNKLHSIFLPTDATYMYLSLWKNKVSFALAAFHFPL